MCACVCMYACVCVRACVYVRVCICACVCVHIRWYMRECLIENIISRIVWLWINSILLTQTNHTFNNTCIVIFLNIANEHNKTLPHTWIHNSSSKTLPHTWIHNSSSKNKTTNNKHLHAKEQNNKVPVWFHYWCLFSTLYPNTLQSRLNNKVFLLVR